MKVRVCYAWTMHRPTTGCTCHSWPLLRWSCTGFSLIWWPEVRRAKNYIIIVVKNAIIPLSCLLSRFTKSQLILHVSAFLEVALSAAITLLIFEPIGSLYFNTCSVNHLSDWYTLFHNPTPNYGEKLHCTQEAVYPLYAVLYNYVWLCIILIQLYWLGFICRQTMVLVFYLLCIVLMVFIRPWLNRKYLKQGKSAVYCALYFLPILALLHTIAGGLICKCYWFQTLVVCWLLQICLCFFSSSRLFLSVFEHHYFHDCKRCTLFDEAESGYEITCGYFSHWD